MKNRFLEEFQKNLIYSRKSTKTIKTYIANIGDLYSFIDSNYNDFDLEKLDCTTIKNYIYYLEKIGNSDSSINLKLSVISAYLSFLSGTIPIKITLEKCVSDLRKKGLSDKSKITFSDEEYERLKEIIMGHSTANPIHSLTFLLLSKGLSPSVVSNIKIEDLDLEYEDAKFGSHISIHYLDRTEKIRIDEEMHYALLEHIRLMKHRCASSHFLLTSEKKQKYTIAGIRYFIRNILSQAGLENHNLNSFKNYYIFKELSNGTSIDDICRRTNLTLEYVKRYYKTTP